VFAAAESEGYRDAALRPQRSAAASSPVNLDRVSAMSDLIYIIQSLLDASPCASCWRAMLLQWARADFRNPISQAIVA